MTSPSAFAVDVPPRHTDMTSLRAHAIPASGSGHPIHLLEVTA